MSPSCWSTLPPEPNQERPLCKKDGHALTKTNSTIPAIVTSTSDDTPASTRSVRRSGHGSLSARARPENLASPRATSVVTPPTPRLFDGDPVLGDDPARLGGLDPLDPGGRRARGR